MDHGNHDRLYLNGRAQTVTPAQIDGWLDTLEAAAPGVRVALPMQEHSQVSNGHHILQVPKWERSMTRKHSSRLTCATMTQS